MDANAPVEARRRLVTFTRRLRAAGVRVPNDGSLEAARVLSEVGATDRDRTRGALRSALVKKPEDNEVFDRLFPLFWRQLIGDLEGDSEDGTAPARAEADTEQIPRSSAPTAEAEDSPADDRPSTQSKITVSNEDSRTNGEDDGERASFARASRSDESTRISSASPARSGDDCASAVASLVETLDGYRHRGRTPSAGGAYLDVRRALRQSYQSGGVIASPPRRAVPKTAVRCAFLVDVSQSVLDVIDREFLVRSLNEFASSCQTIRAYFFDTDLREVTDAIDERTVEAVYEALDRVEAAWGGGTLIGDALETVRTEYPQAIDRDTTVFIISDGLETGDVDLLEDGIVWLSRRARSVFWLNPLAATSSYEPTCRGMAVAEPHVEGIFPFTGAGDFREIANQLRRYTGTQPLGYLRTNADRNR